MARTNKTTAPVAATTAAILAGKTTATKAILATLDGTSPYAAEPERNDNLTAHDAQPSTGGSKARKTRRAAKPAKATSKSRRPEARKARRVIRTYLRLAIAATARELTAEERATYTARATRLEPKLDKALATMAK